jgi:hypothetical protein
MKKQETTVAGQKPVSRDSSLAHLEQPTDAGLQSLKSLKQLIAAQRETRKVTESQNTIVVLLVVVSLLLLLFKLTTLFP